MARNLRDTVDGINEAGWEKAMSADERCERCKRDVVRTYEHHIDNGENGSEWLCKNCYQRVTGTGAYDQENRDWDAERDERDFCGDY